MRFDLKLWPITPAFSAIFAAFIVSLLKQQWQLQLPSSHAFPFKNVTTLYMFSCHSNVSVAQNLAAEPNLCLHDCPKIHCSHCSCMCSSRLTFTYSDAAHQWVHQYWATALRTLLATDMDERGWNTQVNNMQLWPGCYGQLLVTKECVVQRCASNKLIVCLI